MALFLKLNVNVPAEHADKVREAMGKAGSGQLGNYTYCSFSVRGTGRFLPGDGSKPFIGTSGELEQVQEECIESFCEEGKLQEILTAIKSAHPYEEPGIIVSKVEIY